MCKSGRSSSSRRSKSTRTSLRVHIGETNAKESQKCCIPKGRKEALIQEESGTRGLFLSPTSCHPHDPIPLHFRCCLQLVFVSNDTAYVFNSFVADRKATVPTTETLSYAEFRQKKMHSIYCECSLKTATCKLVGAFDENAFLKRTFVPASGKKWLVVLFFNYSHIYYFLFL